MAAVFAGKLPKDFNKLVSKYLLDLPARGQFEAPKVAPVKQNKPKVSVFYKKTDQAHITFGVEGYSRTDKRRYTARVLATILGEGMSSRLFIQVRERRGLAYNIGAGHSTYKDTGIFRVEGALKVEKVYDALLVIKAELERLVKEKVTPEELKKAKEMIRGHIALRSESTNFLAEHFATEFVLERELETFDEYLKKIDAVTIEDILEVSGDLLKNERYNLQVIGPFKNHSEFEKILVK